MWIQLDKSGRQNGKMGRQRVKNAQFNRKLEKWKSRKIQRGEDVHFLIFFGKSTTML